MDDYLTAQLNLPPDMIELGAGQPSPGLLPREFLRQAAEHRLAVSDVAYLAYGAEQGDGYFRHVLASFLSEHYAMRVNPADLFVTGGASLGLELICTLFSKPGDTIFVEEPSYFLALRIFADHGLNVVSLPMDKQGLVIEAIEEYLDRDKPVFLYTIPTYHNPSSVTLAADRRARLNQLSREHRIAVYAYGKRKGVDYPSEEEIVTLEESATGKPLWRMPISAAAPPGRASDREKRFHR